MKQRVDELEELHQSVMTAIKARCTALADTQRLVAKYEYTLHLANKAMTDVKDNSLMKRKDIDIDHVSRASDYRKLIQVTLNTPVCLCLSL